MRTSSGHIRVESTLRGAYTTPMLVLIALACTRAPEPAAPPPAQPGPVVVASEGLAADLAATRAFYDTRPTVERPIRVTGLDGVHGVGSLSATVCRGCHTEIYDEWQVSVHAQAWIDPQFQKEIDKSGNRWLCLNCHTPLLVQHDTWPRGLVDGDVERPILTPNPEFDADLRDEGITCTACHLVGDRIWGPGVSKLADSPHGVLMTDAFRSGELCLTCHQATQTYEGKSFVCVFNTGQEWLDGPYDEEGKNCVTCHMPAVDRPIANGGPVRHGGRHWWRGAGIPKIEGRYPPLEANPPGLALGATVEGGLLRLTATNARAGHRLPSGDPERWVQIDARFVTANGVPVGDPFQHRIGQVWDWTTPPRKRSDNRLGPREARLLVVPIPAGASHAEVEASSHRISQKNAEYHGLDDYPRSVRTHNLRVPIPP